jgi:hypothetical protein
MSKPQEEKKHKEEDAEMKEAEEVSSCTGQAHREMLRLKISEVVLNSRLYAYRSFSSSTILLSMKLFPSKT